ncbi:TPA: hypothetical protein N5N91_004537, partial [Enterobacter roggenkampii]|nr:hypothetical protein [Enterobacter roggenkampii]
SAAVPLLRMYGTASARILGAVAAVPLLRMYGTASARILGAVAAVPLLQHALRLLRTILAGGHRKRQVFQTGAFNVIALDSWNLTMHRNSDQVHNQGKNADQCPVRLYTPMKIRHTQRIMRC